MNTIFWLVVMVVFLLAEAGSVALMCIWFAGGALAALIAALLGGQLWLQIVLFLLVSGVLLAALRPLTKKYWKPRLTKTNVDAMVGKQGYVSVEIDNLNATGQVKLGSMEWTARSESGDVIPQGALVKVERIEGVKAIVSPVSVSETVS